MPRHDRREGQGGDGACNQVGRIDEGFDERHGQNLNAIMRFITKMPMAIQMAPPSSISWPR